MAETHQDLIAEKSLTELEVQECPWPYYQAMNERRFYFDQRLGVFICANYQLMREILRNTKLFSSVNSQNVSHMRTPPAEVLTLQRASQRPTNILVSADPPEHTRVRKILDDPFRPKQIEQLRPRIIEIINDVIDRVLTRGSCDALQDIAIPIPITVIADLLGLDRSFADDIKAWSDASVEPLGMMISDERWIECARIIKAFQDFISSELKKRQNDPKDDLLTHLVQARDEAGLALSLGEMLGVTQQLLVAGNETTTNGIAAGIQLLIENPEQQTRLRAKPDRMYAFVNEVLRLESPVQGLFRIATTDTEIDGLPVPKGARIMLRYAAANRDCMKYEDPDTLNIMRRNSGTQVGFGAGIHHCLGANLAREEMYQTFRILLQRIRTMTFTPEANTFEHHPSMILRGLKHLYIDVEAA